MLVMLMLMALLVPMSALRLSQLVPLELVVALLLPVVRSEMPPQACWQ